MKDKHMKQIGLLGGSSWPSTIAYYQILNTLAQTNIKDRLNANLLLKNLAYHEIKPYYEQGDAGWAAIHEKLKTEIEAFAKLGPDCMVICNNTLHKAYDHIEPKLQLGIPVIHIVDAVAKAAMANQQKDLLLLGTQFTMEDGFYSKRLEQAGLNVTIPNLAERKQIQAMQTRIALGDIEPAFTKAFATLLKPYAHLDALVLGCTELPLVVNNDTTSLPILNPIELQCRAAFEFSMA